MKTAILTAALLMGTASASAQQMASYQGYKVCAVDQTQAGVSVAEDACGRLTAPRIPAGFNSLGELETALASRDSFTQQVDAYGECITQFINSYRRPGAPADSNAPDQAACAHSWAEDQATTVVMEYGRACIDFSNRSMVDGSIEPWSGACYPSFGSGQG